MSTDLRDSITSSLAAFAGQPLRTAASKLLATLGYHSERTINLGDSSPAAFLGLIREHAANSVFSEAKALCADPQGL